MAYDQPNGRIGHLPADIDMSNPAVWQFAPVWEGPAQNVQNVAAGVGGAALVAQGSLTDPALGILQDPVKQGEPGTVFTAPGISRCLVVTAITRVGQPITLVPGGCQPAVSGGWIDGYADETGPANAIIAVRLARNGKMA